MSKIDISNIFDYQTLCSEKQNYETILNMLQSEEGVKGLQIEVQEYGKATWDNYIQPAPIKFNVKDIKEMLIPIIEKQIKKISNDIDKLLIYEESEVNSK